MLSLAAASAAFSPGRGLAADDGHGHGAAAATCATYEFGGIYAAPTGAGQVYTFSAPMVAGACDEWVAHVAMAPLCGECGELAEPAWPGCRPCGSQRRGIMWRATARPPYPSEPASSAAQPYPSDLL